HTDTRQDDATDFGGPMANGMSTFALGCAARAIVDTVAEGDQRALTFFRAHIESRIHAEDQLETRLWLTGRHEDSMEVVFEMRNRT
ncbi:hypothetical protein EV714DRAFT_177048, partial [Schizophyllum commune]